MKNTIQLSRHFLACCLLSIAFTPIAAFGQNSVSLTPSKDNTLYQDTDGLLSNGAGQYLFTGNSGQSLARRAVLAFDLAGAVPEGAVIDSVRLSFTMSRTISPSQTLALHRLTSDWGEGTSMALGNEGAGGAAAAGDATWLHTFFDAALWTTAGGDYAADTSASVAVDTATVYSVGPSDRLNADVQAWLDRPEENFGWILIGNEAAASTAKRINGRNHADAETHPALLVYFTLKTSTESPSEARFNVHSVYPNPFQNQATTSFDLAVPAVVTIDVYDVLGRHVAATTRPYAAGLDHRLQIDAGSLPTGLYLYRITAAQKGRSLSQRTFRLIKTH